MKKLVSFATFAGGLMAGLVSAAPQAAAQSCAMCYQNAAATGAQGRIALERGILILFVPAILFFGGILFLLYSRRHGASRATGPMHGPDKAGSSEPQLSFIACSAAGLTMSGREHENDRGMLLNRYP
jgi:hypothetical protein